MSTSSGGWKRWLKRIALGFLGVIVVGGAGLGIYVWVQTSAYDASMEKVYDVAPLTLQRSTDPAVIARGQHLVRSIAGCGINDCHGADLSGGSGTEAGPIGKMVAPNITPGGVAAAYSDGELGRLIRHGIKRDGRTVRFMSVQELTWLPDADVVAVISYIRSVPPVDKPNGATVIKTFGKILDRKELIPIDIARRIDHDHIVAGPPPSPTVEYGAYVARLCSGCHGPSFSGGPLPGTPPDFPVPLNLTPDPTGLAGWTYADFEHFTTTGLRKNGQHVASFMPVEALANMDDTERHALWAYLSSRPPTQFGNR